MLFAAAGRILKGHLSLGLLRRGGSGHAPSKVSLNYLVPPPSNKDSSNSSNSSSSNGGKKDVINGSSKEASKSAQDKVRGCEVQSACDIQLACKVSRHVKYS